MSCFEGSMDFTKQCGFRQSIKPVNVIGSYHHPASSIWKKHTIQKRGNTSYFYANKLVMIGLLYTIFFNTASIN